MLISLEQVQKWLLVEEGETIEFKEAKGSFSFESLAKYVTAIANEGGGYIVFGVSPKVPRRVVGSGVWPDFSSKAHEILQRTHLRVDVAEVQHPDGRVLVFKVPGRSIGTPVALDGAYWMRAGESLVAMTPERLKSIFDEAVADFSAEVSKSATIEDLDPVAIARFRLLWRQRSNNPSLDALSDIQLLEDAGLLVSGAVTHAAIVLLGKAKPMARLLGQAEVIFEYRSDEMPGPANQRVEFRQGFLTFFDELWNLINLRNDKQSYQDGLLMRYVETFDERVCREAILNAISHRDYRSGASVSVQQFPRHMLIESPGGFPDGVDQENLLFRQSARNRLLADSLAKCGFVERAGQGADLMFRRCIEQGKGLPDYSGTDKHWVNLRLHGSIKDPQFIRYLEGISKKTGRSFGVRELLVLSAIHDERTPGRALEQEVTSLVACGAIERVSRNKLVLARKFYEMAGRPGEYTRRRGLDRETNKELLVRHITAAGVSGAKMAELLQVLPAKSRHDVGHLLVELRREGRVHMRGIRRGAAWQAGPEPEANLPVDEGEMRK